MYRTIPRLGPGDLYRQAQSIGKLGTCATLSPTSRRMTIKNLVEVYEPTDVPTRHPSLFEPKTFFLAVMLGLLGVIIGVELITRVGVNPNTSIIGAVIAIAASRIPLAAFTAKICCKPSSPGQRTEERTPCFSPWVFCGW